MTIDEYITIAIQSAKKTNTDIIWFDLGIVVDAGELFVDQESGNRIKFSVKVEKL